MHGRNNSTELTVLSTVVLVKENQWIPVDLTQVHRETQLTATISCSLVSSLVFICFTEACSYHPRYVLVIGD